MRILLVGEFSRLHNSLKEGLTALGHEAHIVGTGDDFKKYPVDFPISSTLVASNSLLRFCNRITRKLFRLDLEAYERTYRFRKLLPILKGYDVVQLINSNAIETYPKLALRLYEKLFAQNSKKFLLICGDETPIVDVLLKNNLKYSVLTPYFNDPAANKYYNYTLNYTNNQQRKLFDFVQTNCDGLLVSDLDYKIPMEQTGFDFTFIPNPINTDKLEFIPMEIPSKIVIFHGVNKYSAVKKGSSVFLEALSKIELKYGNKVEIRIVNSLPYDEYQKHIRSAHIILDQIYAFDQGYNALEAMALGKVVFTGAETEFQEYYQLTDSVAINALPDVESIVQQLSFLIENPEELTLIGKRARQFIEKEHHFVKIAEIYTESWNTTNP
ncbi:glycosyltransferase [uncultured Flavobacterium sp.]|uniref:glycosyltransferase family protein n=1 Tax=uncultured Flavobacterium sp. TaxID=165435 RepID=UPI00120DBEA8|nr:glycosyltransferase [uncultured Flavobacterium sp.]THD30450.1 MAG: glycosyltransferase family 1 protein [Flavobacterium johnsoniae]